MTERGMSESGCYKYASRMIDREMVMEIAQGYKKL